MVRGLQLYAQLFGDLQLLHGIHVTARWMSHYSAEESPLYIYHFTLAAKNGLSFFFSTRNLKGRCLPLCSKVLYFPVRWG